MSKRAGFMLLTIGLLAGAGVGSFATWKILWRPAEPRHEVRYPAPQLEEQPEGWLLGPGTNFETIYPDELIRAAIIKPDQVEIHLAQVEGPLQVEEWRFSGQGRKPDPETLTRLIYGLQSVNSYRGLAACGFSPGVLVKLTKDGKTHDLLFCFMCSDLRWRDGGIGMSKEGIPVFLKCFADTFPESEELKNLRKHADTP